MGTSRAQARDALHFPGLDLPPPTRRLREEVGRFLDDALAEGRFEPRCDAWIAAHDPAFSRELGQRGWLGLTWPSPWGAGRSNLDRYVVVEQLLAAGAPVAAHWFAERQVGPAILKHGTDEQRERFLPPIVRGELYVAIGLSEPDSGSDLASIRTRAHRDGERWVLSGTKIWTSHADRSHLILALCRTGDPEGRQEGLTQFLVDLSAPGVQVEPIRLMTGEAHFCQVVFDDVAVDDQAVLGEVGAGWRQVMDELAYERSGPERFLSTYPLLRQLLDHPGAAEAIEPIGNLVADLLTLRELSASIAHLTDEGGAPGVQAAVVKDLGARFEHDVIEVARRFMERDAAVGGGLRRAFEESVLASPSFALRGGTTEIMRGIVARGLGAR